MYQQSLFLAILLLLTDSTLAMITGSSAQGSSSTSQVTTNAAEEQAARNHESELEMIATTEAFNLEDIDSVNLKFYNDSGDFFNAIPFAPLLPDLFHKYVERSQILEIGSGPGGLAVWLKEQGHDVTCLEPADKLADAAAAKGLRVHPLTIQAYETDSLFDCVVAISSLIHVPKAELPAQIEKIAKFLKPKGTFL